MFGIQPVIPYEMFVFWRDVLGELCDKITRLEQFYVGGCTRALRLEAGIGTELSTENPECFQESIFRAT